MGLRQVQGAVVWLLGASEGSSRSAGVGASACLTAAVGRRPVVDPGAEERPWTTLEAEAEVVEVVEVEVVVVVMAEVVMAEVAVVVEERGSRAAEAVRAPRNRRSSLVESVHSGTLPFTADVAVHSGTLPCLRRGSSSRLVANIRSPATSFWRVSAGSITSSM